MRLAAFNLPSIAKLTMTDELHLQELGERKIALFCCIPDSDKSLNYLVGMIYTQLIQTLYRQADRVHKGRLPVPVHCLMDEYANISLPKDTFLSALATMRSRAIFCSIIVQNMAQLKAMYKDDWESLVGLCDEFLYLGGTEKETHKYVSELLGKETISTTSYNQSKGRSGSYSINHQQSGRDLMTPDEVRLLDNSKCIRTRDRIRQIVSSGHYTGGFVCYGYQLVDQGRRNKRDKPVMDLVINEEESTWVRELFYKVIQEGASGYALAEMLNNRGLRTRAGAKFQSSNIIRIIRHEGYTGYIITKNARSEYIPELQIIDRETFDKANDIINRRKAKSEQERKIAHTSQNPTLLAGIVYCAHCGAKMSGFMHTDRYKLADGSIREKVQPKYNCFQRGQRNKGGRDCDGQALYLAEKVDAIVLQAVSKIFEQIRDTPYSRMAENRIRQESNLQKSKRASVEKKIKTAQHALERFEGEILKCLDGTSNFTEDMIAKQIRRYQQELDDAKAEYAALQNARLNEAAEIRKLRTYYDEFRGWAEEFDAAPLEIKRMILSQLIERVEVGRKYQVTIKLNMEYQQFLEITEEQKLIPLISA